MSQKEREREEKGKEGVGRRVARLVAWLVECLSALRSCYVYLDARGETNFQSQCREVVKEKG